MLHKKLEAFRLLNGLNKSAMARKLGISRQYYNKVERPGFRPSFQLAAKIQKITDNKVTFKDLRPDLL